MDLPWDDLRVLIALLRTRSLVGAAESLGLDRSTISRRVVSIERQIGAPLFLRTREGLRPAAAAERLRPHLERVEAEILAFQVALGSSDDGASGLVRVATSEAFATFLVQKGLLDLRRDHPGIVLELLGGNRPLDLLSGEADVALRFVPPKEAALKVRCVARMAFGLYGAPTYLRARGLPRSAVDLAGHDVLVLSAELAMLPEGPWLEHQPGVHVAMRANSFPTLIAAAVEGHGLIVLPRPWGALEQGLDLLFPVPEIPERALWLVVQPEMARRPEVRIVVERLANIVERLMGG